MQLKKAVTKQGMMGKMGSSIKSSESYKDAMLNQTWNYTEWRGKAFVTSPMHIHWI